MVNSYVNQAVQKDPEEVSRRIGDKILQNIKHKKEGRKKGVSQSPQGAKDPTSEKKLRSKLRINSRLQMVLFQEHDFDEDEEQSRKSQKMPQDNMLTILTKN